MKNPVEGYEVIPFSRIFIYLASYNESMIED